MGNVFPDHEFRESGVGVRRSGCDRGAMQCEALHNCCWDLAVLAGPKKIRLTEELSARTEKLYSKMKLCLPEGIFNPS